MSGFRPLLKEQDFKTYASELLNVDPPYLKKGKLLRLPKAVVRTEYVNLEFVSKYVSVTASWRFTALQGLPL